MRLDSGAVVARDQRQEAARDGVIAHIGGEVGDAKRPSGIGSVAPARHLDAHGCKASPHGGGGDRIEVGRIQHRRPDSLPRDLAALGREAAPGKEEGGSCAAEHEESLRQMAERLPGRRLQRQDAPLIGKPAVEPPSLAPGDSEIAEQRQILRHRLQRRLEAAYCAGGIAGNQTGLAEAAQARREAGEERKRRRVPALRVAAPSERG